MAPVIGPSAHTDTHARTHTHTHIHTRRITLWWRKAIHRRSGTSRSFYSTNTPPTPQLPDVTSQQSEIIFSGIIIPTQSGRRSHSLSFLSLLSSHFAFGVSLIYPGFAGVNRHQIELFFTPNSLKEKLKRNHEQSQFENDFPRMRSEICSSDQLSVYSL